MIGYIYMYGVWERNYDVLGNMSDAVILTTQELAIKSGISLDSLDQECSDSDLLALSEFCDPWEIVGRHLQLTDPEISIIDSDHKTTEQKRLASLKKWKGNKAFGATFKAFIDALLACKGVQKAHQVCEYRARQIDQCVTGRGGVTGSSSETNSAVHSERSSDLNHEWLSQAQTGPRLATNESERGYKNLSDRTTLLASRLTQSYDDTSHQAYQTRRKGFVCSFTSSNPLICPLCKCILRKPHTLQCCKQNFCEFCISRVREKGTRCSQCKSAIVHHPNKALEEALLQFEVHCANKCGWKGSLKEHDSHENFNPSDDTWLDGCKEVTVQCIYCKSESTKRKYILQKLEYRFPESKVDSVNSITCNVEVYAKWDIIGMELGLEVTVLQAIRLSYPQNEHKECYYGMLKEWIESSEGANWKALLNVFRKPTVNVKHLATKIEQALLCDKACDTRVNRLIEEIDKCVIYDYKEQKTKLEALIVAFKKQESQRLNHEGEKRELNDEKQALLKKTEFQLKDIRDHLKNCQNLFQEESIDLEFERNVKLHELGLGKPQRARYKDTITLGGIVAGLVGGIVVLTLAVFMAMNDFRMSEVFLVLLVAVGGGELVALFVGWPIGKLMGVIINCIIQRSREKKKKDIDEHYARLLQKCHDKIEANIQPVIRDCEELLTRIDTFAQQE